MVGIWLTLELLSKGWRLQFSGAAVQKGSPVESLLLAESESCR